MPSLLPPAAASSGRLWSQPATTPRSVEGNGFYWAGLLSLSLLSLLLGGCFSRGYETGYSAAVERYRTASEYARLQPQPHALGQHLDQRAPLELLPKKPYPTHHHAPHTPNVTTGARSPS